MVQSKPLAIFIALVFSSLVLNSCQENRYLPLEGTDLVLAENKETGLRGIMFRKGTEYNGAEILPVKYADITPSAVKYDYDYQDLHMQFLAHGVNGKTEIVKVNAYVKSSDDKKTTVVNPHVIASGETVEIIRIEDEKVYYMCHDSKGKTLVCVRNKMPYFGKTSPYYVFGPYDDIVPMFDYNQCLATKNGLVSIQSLNDFFDCPLYKSPHQEVVLYHMESAKRKFKYEGFDWTENMGGEFYVYPNGKGGYVMSQMFSGNDDGQYLLPIYTLTSAQWEDICAHDTSAEELLVKTGYFPESIVGKLYKAGRKATMWGIW